jgi:hypothetical protein
MVQGGSGLRFALETGKGLRISGYFVRKKLESDEPVKPGVFGFVHNPHASAAKLLNDTVVRDCLDQQGDPKPSGRFILWTRRLPVNERWP